MKLVTYVSPTGPRLGALRDGRVFDLAHTGAALGKPLPADILALLEGGEPLMDLARQVLAHAPADAPYALDYGSVQLLSPVPRPPSLRDAYAFRQHVATARRNRGAPMIPEFDEIPIFYFSNHNAVVGPGQVSVRQRHLDRLDFELECAAVIGRRGRDIPAGQADSYIAGFAVMNDLSARGLQLHEMKLNLGPAKGKDFATAVGPWLVTRDELEAHRVDGAEGERYDLEMTASVNGVQVSQDSLANMSWTFAQILERVSYGVEVFPGDIIGSGTCGTGCFLELNGSKITADQWLADGDVVELSIAGLGTLTNTIVLDEP